MFNPNQQVYTGTDVGRVVYYDYLNDLVSIMHRKNDYSWYQKTYPVAAVTSMTIGKIPWDLNTPFQTKKYVPQPKSWLDNLWTFLAA
jgi:hypothetical protein